MKKLLPSLLAGLLVSGTVLAKDWTEVRIGMEPSYPPFSKLSPSGKIEGFEPELLALYCAEMKLKCTLVSSEFDGLIPGLLAKKFDVIMSSMSINAERKQKVNFSDRYYITPSQLVAKQGSPLLPTAAALKGKTIGVQRGSVSADYALATWQNQGVNVRQYSKTPEAYMDLTSGRLDAVFADKMEIQQGFLAKNSPKFSLIGTPVTDTKYIGEGIGMAFRKEDQDLTARFNEAIKKVQANGGFKKLSDRYFKYDISKG